MRGASAVLLAFLAPAAPIFSQDFGETLPADSFRTVQDQKSTQDLIKSRASLLEQLSRDPDAPAGRPAVLTGAGSALAELAGQAGAPIPGAPEVSRPSLLAFDQNGRPLGPAEAADAEAIIKKIVAEYVHAGVAQKPVEQLLRVAVGAAPEAVAGMRGAAGGLMQHLRDQVFSRMDPNYPRRPTGFWPVEWQGDMPAKILATYSGGVIRVGPSFAKKPVPFQMTIWFHEGLHGFDDGDHGNGPGSTDGSSIDSNDFTGTFVVDKTSPPNSGASEKQSYTLMNDWMFALSSGGPRQRT